jgi:hypothetical protein
MSCVYPTGIYPPQNCVMKFITPKVTAAAQDFFGCPTLNGAEIENTDTSACVVQGSHWEQRIWNTDFLSAYQRHWPAVTAATLALLEDSGW